MASKGRKTRGKASNGAALKAYWSNGPGAAKVRWGTPGDWKRCVNHVSKFMGPRAKGYCQLRHMQATGMTTSAHAKALRGGRGKR